MQKSLPPGKGMAGIWRNARSANRQVPAMNYNNFAANSGCGWQNAKWRRMRPASFQ